MTTQSPWREQSPSGNSPTDDRATPGTVIGGRYELVTAIGHGGMGTVWRSTDTLLHREVAVKEVLLPPTMPQHEKDALCERTMREARAAAALAHPSVVQVYDVVIDANRPWIVMELLEARSLADMVIDDGPLPPRAVAKIGIAMLGALEVAHAAGVLHRDVKPANVLICDDGRCVLTDFGVARLPTESKLTTPGMVLGSPHFISPERAVGGAFGPPSDLFSLGVTLYTAVEGGPPFDRGDPFETMRAVVEEAPRPARLAGPLKPVLWGLLEKDPEHRWNVERSRTALRDLLATTLAPARTGPARAMESSGAAAGPAGRPPVTAAGPPGIRTGAVGGRAMLDPNEPIDDQVARLRESAGLGPGDADRRSGDDVTRAIPTSWITPEDRQGVDVESQGSGREAPGGRRAGRVAGRPDPGPREVWWDSPSRADRPSWAGGESWGGVQPPGHTSHRGAGTAARARWGDTTTRREHIGRRRAPTLTSRVTAQVGARAAVLRREITDPRNRSRVIVVGGLVTILLAVAITAWSGVLGGGGGQETPPGDPAASSTGSTPLIEVQEFRERGIAVNVPAAWVRTEASSYVDYTDPAMARWVRINIEPTSLSPMGLLEGAEARLQDPAVCPAPYTRVALVEAQLAGQAGAELEYTCGEGDGKRHGIWRAVVRDGVAYHFYLTAPDAAFADSRIVYDELLRSFQFV